jgi:nucleoside-diphosphate-sugar epimerase
MSELGERRLGSSWGDRDGPRAGAPARSQSAARIALEQAPAGTLLNAVGDEGVPFKDIAGAIARHLDVPVKSIHADEAADHFGMPFAIFAQLNAPASGKRTQERFGWEPTEPGLIADIDLGHYFTATASH